MCPLTLVRKQSYLLVRYGPLVMGGRTIVSRPGARVVPAPLRPRPVFHGLREVDVSSRLFLSLKDGTRPAPPVVSRCRPSFGPCLKGLPTPRGDLVLPRGVPTFGVVCRSLTYIEE